MDIIEKINNQIADNKILLYMKGSPDKPECGFSQRASQILMACGKEFSFVDILSNPEIRQELPSVSEWPTFPQLFINGELVGGSDIMMEMYQNGELKELIDSVEIYIGRIQLKLANKVNKVKTTVKVCNLLKAVDLSSSRALLVAGTTR